MVELRSFEFWAPSIITSLHFPMCYGDATPRLMSHGQTSEVCYKYGTLIKADRRPRHQASYAIDAPYGSVITMHGLNMLYDQHTALDNLKLLVDVPEGGLSRATPPTGPYKL